MSTIARIGLAPTRAVLDNGAVVVVKDTHTSPAVTISASFDAGSVDEPPHLMGLSHFLSRVIDRATETRDAESLAEQFESRGVSLAAGGSLHALTLTCTCLAEDFDQILALMADVARRATYPPEEVEARRGEIITTIRQDEDNPAVQAVEGVLGLLYPGHPYSHPGKGTIETVARIDREVLVAFHRSHILPGSLSLVIVGDVATTHAIGEAARVFGSWRGVDPVAVELPPVTPARARRRLTIPMTGKAQADIAYGFTTISRLDPEYCAFWIMNTALGQFALGGRLGDSIRERQGMAYYVFSAFDAEVAEGPLIIRAGVHPSNVERAVASIDEEVGRMAASGLTVQELEESKQFLIGSLSRALETNMDIASFLQTAERFHLGLDYDVRLPALLDAVTMEEANQMARRFLSPERAAVVVAGPQE
jgi:zinc protease